MPVLRRALDPTPGLSRVEGATARLAASRIRRFRAHPAGGTKTSRARLPGIRTPALALSRWPRATFSYRPQPATGGVWLDKGEWEALKSKGLHVSLHLIFTASYQRQIRSAEYVQTLTETFRDRIGPADFATVTVFANWLAHHPKGRDICCYLLDNLEQKSEA